MGLINSRRSTSVEEADTTTGNLYRYPPKSGCYFGNYFIMGGERFDTNQQDTYLFGENEDLNFLGSKPVPFPYPAPQPHEPTKTLKSLVNIRRDSLKFIKETDDIERIKPETEVASSSHYNVEFTFDSDVKCAITIYYFATEEIINKQTVYHPRDARMNSETFHYKRGANQVFSQSTHVIDPTQFSEDDWLYSVDREVIPVVIHCVVEEEEFIGHSHTTFAIVDKSCDGGFVLKCLKQKQMIDGVCYLLQEIYGIENKNVERAKQEDDMEDNGSECVICMCETRDTLILPCRHLCLCNGCADNLRYQANNCPICRAKFSALLQIRAMRRKVPVCIGGTTAGGSLPSSLLSSRPPIENGDDTALCQEGVPAGYEAVSLIEALNGPPLPQCALSATVMHNDGTVQSLSSAESPRDDSTGRMETSHTGNGDINRHPSCAELSMVSETGLAVTSSSDSTVSVPDITYQNDGSDVVVNVYEDTEPEPDYMSVHNDADLRCESSTEICVQSIEADGCISQPDDVILKVDPSQSDGASRDSSSSGLLNVGRSDSNPDSTSSSKELLDISHETADSEFL